MTLIESSLKLFSPSSLAEASVSEISIESHDLWYKQLHEYLKWNAFPTDMAPIEKHAFKHQATHYMFLGDILYKHSFDGILLHFLQLYDQQIVISNCHDGICSGHFNSIAIAKCVLQMGYYWPTMKHACNEYIKKCVSYHQHTHLQHILSQPL